MLGAATCSDPVPAWLVGVQVKAWWIGYTEDQPALRELMNGVLELVTMYGGVVAVAVRRVGSELVTWPLTWRHYVVVVAVAIIVVCRGRNNSATSGTGPKVQAVADRWQKGQLDWDMPWVMYEAIKEVVTDLKVRVTSEPPPLMRVQAD